MRPLLVTLALCCAFTAGSAGATGSSGVGGVLYRGPITPVCRVGVACDSPAPGVTLVFTRAGRAFRTRTGVGGRFSLVLEPGVYGVRGVRAARIGSGISPRSVRVLAGRWVRVRLTLDTGIR